MPKLVYENHAMPVFYRGVMYREGAEGKEEAYLKLYDGHDWKWFCVRLNHTDMEYLRKNWSGKKASAPILEKRHHKYFLRFSYTEEITLTKTPVFLFWRLSPVSAWPMPSLYTASCCGKCSVIRQAFLSSALR